MSFILDLIMGNLASIGAGITVVFALFGWGTMKKRAGVKKERREAKEADRERADELRDAAMDVRVDPDGGLRERFEDDGFRD